MRAHHDGSPAYVSSPSPALGETVTVFVRTRGVHEVWVRTRPDGEARYHPAVLDHVARTPFVEQVWRAEVTVVNPVTAYRFLLRDGAHAYHWLTASGCHDREVPDATDFRLLASAPPPEWVSDAVVYEIFPDRFARSARAAGRALPDWAIECDWATTPVIHRGPETPRQFYGGDLDGIVEHLDHLDDLGVNTIYLTPIFPARSNHRYDAASFDRVDPLLGGDAALDRLADAVHRRGWRLLGDLTTNHCGDAHPWFTAAVSDVDAPEREMFYIDGDTYESWWNVKTLPKFNWGSTELRRRFLTGPDAVATRWLGRFDGWRVDVANMTGRLGVDDYAHEVARLMRGVVTAAHPDALLVAEHVHDPTDDLDVGGWHGAMNYSGVLRPLWTWLRSPEPPPANYFGAPGGVPRRTGRQAVATMRDFAGRVSWRSLSTSWNLLSTHDSARIRTVVGSAERQEVAAGLLVGLPGTPMVFAGDELGLTGVDGEDSRTPMPWHDRTRRNMSTVDTYRRLIRLRRNHPALRVGGLRWLHVGDDVLVFLRESPEQRLLVQARRAAGPPITIDGLDIGEAVYGPSTVEKGVLPGDGPSFGVWQIPA